MTPPCRNPLWDLDAAGVQLRLADDGRLQFHPPTIPPELVERIRGCKGELVGMLRETRATADGRLDLERVDWLAAQEWFAERAAIREYDGLEPRVEAAAGAIREVVGELLRGAFH